MFASSVRMDCTESVVFICELANLSYIGDIRILRFSFQYFIDPRNAKNKMKTRLLNCLMHYFTLGHKNNENSMKILTSLIAIRILAKNVFHF